MTRRYIIIAAIAAVISVTLVLGGASFMASLTEVWAAEEKPLPVLLRRAVQASQFVQSYKALVVLFLIAGSVGMVSLPHILSRRRAQTA